jgi:hypothetical protein
MTIRRRIYLKTTNMGNLLYLVAVVFIILWAIGFFGYNMGALIHVLLVVALVAVILRIISGSNRPII